MWFDAHPSTRWLISYLLAMGALGASCTFVPGQPPAGANGDDGSPDARAIDAARAPDAAGAPDAGQDAGVALDLTLGLLAHWPLDRIDGTTVRTTPDVAGGFDGEVRGTATIVPGTIDGALSLDGSSGFVRIADAPELDVTGAITLAAWCRPRGFGGFRIILAHGTSFSPDGEVYLRLLDRNYQTGSWDGDDAQAVSPVPDADVDAWVHLAGVYDGQTWRLYRNGVEVDTGGSTGAVSVDEAWAIGARSQASADRFFQGDIDDVRIYGRALSAVEIAALAALR